MQGFTLGRKVDFSYKTNLAVSLLTLLIIIPAALIQGSFIGGLLTGAGFFLTWALTREMDPLHDFSAFLAGAFFLLGLIFFAGLDLALLFWLLLSLRFISGICGKKPTFLDLIVIFGFSSFLAIVNEQSFYWLLLTLVLGLAYWRYQGDRRLGFSALISSGLFLLGLFFWPLSPGFIFSFSFFQGALILLAVLLPIIFLTQVDKKEQGFRDDEGKTLKPRDINLARGFFAAVFVLLLTGESMVQGTYFLLFSVLAGALVFRLGKRLKMNI